MNDERIWSRLSPLLPATYAASYVPLHTARTHNEMRQMLADHCTLDSHLIGFSMGGYLALEHTLTHPLRSLTLIASAAQGLSQPEQKLRSDMLKWLQAHDYTGMARHRLHALIHADHLQDEAILNLVRQMDRELGKSVLVSQLRETSTRANLLPQLAQLTCPVLLIDACDDQIVNSSNLLAMQAALPHAECHILPD